MTVFSSRRISNAAVRPVNGQMPHQTTRQFLSLAKQQDAADRAADLADDRADDRAADRNMMIMLCAAVAIGIAIMMAGTSANAAGTSSGDSYSAPKAASAQMRKAIAAIKSEDFAGALVHLATETAANEKNADAWNLTGFASRKLGRYDASAIAYDKALALNPKHKGALEYKGELYLTLGQPDQAEEMLARLKRACSFNCSEVKDLENAIAAYKTAN